MGRPKGSLNKKTIAKNLRPKSDLSEQDKANIKAWYKRNGTAVNMAGIKLLAIDMLKSSFADVNLQSAIDGYSDKVVEHHIKLGTITDKKQHRKLKNLMSSTVTVLRGLQKDKRDAIAWYKSKSRETFSSIWAIGASGANPNAVRERLTKIIGEY